MADRPIRQLVRAVPASEGAGVTVYRTIGTPALRHLDPFLMLDHFGSDDPDEYIAGFPEHPHRGFITLTYMIDGHMLHQDSMGNRGDLHAGGVQWMKAASGVIHSEMPQQANGLMRGFQLWINLPAKEKMSDPEYQEFGPEKIPVVETAGLRVKVVGGSYGSSRGPIMDPNTHILYLDVMLDTGRDFVHAFESDFAAFIYLYEGNTTLGATELPRHALAVLGDGENVRMRATTPARFILVAGRPLREPVVQYGPFVMTSRDEVEQAFEDYRNNRLVRERARTTSA